MPESRDGTGTRIEPVVLPSPGGYFARASASGSGQKRSTRSQGRNPHLHEGRRTLHIASRARCFPAALFWTLAIVWTTQVLTRIDLVTDSGQSALAFLRDRDADPAVDHSDRRALRRGHRRGADAERDEHQFGTGRHQRRRKLALGDDPAGHDLSRWWPASSPLRSHNGVDPYARQRGRQMVAAARGDLLSLVIQEGTFRKIDDGPVRPDRRTAAGRPARRHLRRRFARRKASTSSTTPRPAPSCNATARMSCVMNDGVIHRKRRRATSR